VGWVAPPQDPQALARAIREAHAEWAGDQPAWQQRRVEARRRIVERFTFDRMAAAYEKVWDKVARNP
jgi:glycosyltransferase involved in cell wall biosynthesis